MKTYDFRIGDLLVSEQGTIAIVHYLSVNMNGNNAVFLLTTKRQDNLDVLPYAIVDIKLTADIDAGRYKYYPIIT